MLTVNGLHNFYYVPGVTDMRCGYHRLMVTVHFSVMRCKKQVIPLCVK